MVFIKNRTACLTGPDLKRVLAKCLNRHLHQEQSFEHDYAQWNQKQKWKVKFELTSATWTRKGTVTQQQIVLIFMWIFTSHFHSLLPYSSLSDFPNGWFILHITFPNTLKYWVIW
jgi:hypothetical protein